MRFKIFFMQLSEKVKKLIDGKNFATVATLMPDGSPQISPVWIDRDGDTILLNATGGRQKTRNLRRDSRIAISIFDQSNPYDKALIRGKVVEISGKGAEDHIDKLNMKYHGTPKYPYHTPDDPRVLIKVDAHRLSD